MQNLTQQEIETAEKLFEAYAATLQIAHHHKAQEHIKTALLVTTRNRGEVQARIEVLRREARQETNPKRNVALLQPQSVATETQGATLSEIPTNQHNQNEPQQEQPQSEVVAGVKGRKKMHKAAPVLRFGTRTS